MAKESGEAFEEVLEAKGYSPEMLDKIHEHADQGDTAALVQPRAGHGGAVGAGGDQQPGVYPEPARGALVLTPIIVVLSVSATVYVYLTGDSGAASVWSNTF